MRYIYHPQQSWGKVIFSEACVKNSVNRGGCLGPGRGGGVGNLAGGCLLRARGEVGGSGGGLGPEPGGRFGLSRPILVEGCPGPHLGGVQAHTWGVSQNALRQTPPTDDYHCRRYASYWNTFLLNVDLLK